LWLALVGLWPAACWYSFFAGYHRLPELNSIQLNGDEQSEKISSSPTLVSRPSKPNSPSSSRQSGQQSWAFPADNDDCYLVLSAFIMGVPFCSEV
jgi:hypothetical protein